MRDVADYVLIILVAALLTLVVYWGLPTTSDIIRFVMALVPATAFSWWLGRRRTRKDKE